MSPPNTASISDRVAAFAPLAVMARASNTERGETRELCPGSADFRNSRRENSATLPINRASAGRPSTFWAVMSSMRSAARTRSVQAARFVAAAVSNNRQSAEDSKALRLFIWQHLSFTDLNADGGLSAGCCSVGQLYHRAHENWQAGAVVDDGEDKGPVEDDGFCL